MCGHVVLALVDGVLHRFDAGCFFLPLGGVVGVLLHYEGGIAKLPLEGGYLLLGARWTVLIADRLVGGNQ